VATRKITDLTLLTSVSSSDTLLLVDNSDPVDRNKRSAVGSIFQAIPGGTPADPGLAFELKTSTGLYSTTQGQIGLALGDAKLNLQKFGNSLVIGAVDTSTTNLDLTIQAQGAGYIRLASPLAIVDSIFGIPNTSDQSKVINFSAAAIPANTTRTFVFPGDNLPTGQVADFVVTTFATQTLINKTLANPIFTGTLNATSLSLSGNLTVDGNTTLGTDASDTVTVVGTASFSQAISGALGVTGAVTLSSTLNVTGATTLSSTLNVTGNGTFSSQLTSAGDFKVNTNKFVVTAASGNTAIAGTLGVTGTSNLSATNILGDLAVDTTTLVVNSSSNRVGIKRAPTTYDFEVDGDIYFTGDQIIGGNPAGNLNIQKGALGIETRFTSSTGTTEMVLDGSGKLGLGINPTVKCHVNGDGRFEGNLTLVETDPQTQTGGTLTAARIVLVNLVTGTQRVIGAETSGSISRAKAFFHAYS
jgi:hypothetical protein